MIVKTWHQESYNEGWYEEREGCDICECEDPYEAESYRDEFLGGKAPTPTTTGFFSYDWNDLECICEYCAKDHFNKKIELREVL